MKYFNSILSEDTELNFFVFLVLFFMIIFFMISLGSDTKYYNKDPYEIKGKKFRQY